MNNTSGENSIKQTYDCEYTLKCMPDLVRLGKIFFWIMFSLIIAKCVSVQIYAGSIWNSEQLAAEILAILAHKYKQ